MFFNKFKYHKKNFKVIGLIDEDIDLFNKSKIITAPHNFIAPKKIDSRDMLLSSSDQQDNPYCAGYTAAGYIEYHHWKTKHYPLQVDGKLIYEEAKKIDNNNIIGTTLKSAAQACINLKLIDGTPKYIKRCSLNNIDISSNENDILSIKFALHQHGVVMAGLGITNEWEYVEKKTGIISNFAKIKNKDIIQKGPHAVLLCGYDLNGLYIQNSWGDQWGHHGFAILPWNMFTKQFMSAMIIESHCFS